MIDIEKVRKLLADERKHINLTGGLSGSKEFEQAVNIFKRIRNNELPILYLAPKNSAVIVNAKEYKNALDELERLQKKEEYLNQFKNSKYVVIQDSVAKGFEFTDIKKAVNKLYSLKANNEYDIAMLFTIGGDKVFAIAERKLVWSDEECLLNSK